MDKHHNILGSSREKMPSKDRKLSDIAHGQGS